MAGRLDPYKVLGVDPSAEPEVIAAAHRVLARRHHPDVSPDPEAEATMAEINAAWTILRDPVRRAAWDREQGIRDGQRAGDHDNPLGSLSPKPASAATTGTGAHDAARQGEIVWRRGPDGEGAAGPPPGRPVGSVLPFGRHIGWSLGEVARIDPGYLQWLATKPEGRPYLAEIERFLAPILRTIDGRGPVPQSGGPESGRDAFRRR
jgi:curved DNA-binding protein CbpA